MSENRPRLRAVTGPAACPICSKATEARYKPFCSARCGQIDLGRWLNDVYRLPAETISDDEAEIPGRSDRRDDT